jgi:hypothetical protein
MDFSPNFLTSQIGSIPHHDGDAVCDWLVKMVDIPAWPQLPQRSFRESMYVQGSSSLPAIIADENKGKIIFDTSEDISPALGAFYERYLADDVDGFSLPPEDARGFYAMLERMPQTPGAWVKGQVTGPISFGLTVTDQNLRASLYDDMLADVIVKNVAMNARWQIRQLKAVRPNVILFVDEPYMASFGSAYVSLGREQVIAMLDEVYAAIHEEGALGGIHCCGNTDWSILLETQVDILNLDAYSYLEHLSLYSAELQRFIARGGCIAWGIVPTSDEIFRCSAEGLADRLHKGMELICQKARMRGVSISLADLASHSLVTPSCGLGSTTVATAERVLEMLVKTGEILKQGG